MLVSLGAMVGTSMLCQSIPYTEGFGAKQVAWMLHSGVVGAVIAPLCVLGGPLLTRAALYTAGVVGGRIVSEKSCVFATTFRPIYDQHDHVCKVKVIFSTPVPPGKVGRYSTFPSIELHYIVWS